MKRGLAWYCWSTPRTVSRWPRTSRISMAEIFSGLVCAKAAQAGSAARNWRREWRIWRDYSVVQGVGKLPNEADMDGDEIVIGEEPFLVNDCEFGRSGF